MRPLFWLTKKNPLVKFSIDALCVDFWPFFEVKNCHFWEISHFLGNNFFLAGFTDVGVDH